MPELMSLAVLLALTAALALRARPVPVAMHRGGSR
jgi:hypothetical protein